MSSQSEEIHDNTVLKTWHKLLNIITGKKEKYPEKVDSALDISPIDVKSNRSFSSTHSLKFITDYEECPLEFLTCYENEANLEFITRYDSSLNFITEYVKPVDEFITIYTDDTTNLEFLTNYDKDSMYKRTSVEASK